MYETAELLIENAANLEAVGELGNRPLHLAAAADQAQLVGLLLAKGAQTMYKNAYGNTPLKVAVGARAAGWIRRVDEGGEPERSRLAEELRAAREEAAHKREAAEEEASLR